MRCLLFLLSVVVAATLVSSSPAHRNRAPATRRTVKQLPVSEPHQFPRARRSAQYTKGGGAPVKGHTRPAPMELNLRKGEYLCGGKVCRLQPGDVPKNCNGECQYRVSSLFKK